MYKDVMIYNVIIYNNVKLVRNLFGDLKIIVDGSNRLIKWQYIIDLNNLQQELHLNNKLRSAHIQYQKQKMKIHLVTQLFSTFVAEALTICKEYLRL